MENTIEKIYYGTINDGAEWAAITEAEEDEAYRGLEKTLTAEQRALLEQYERLVCERQNKALEETYKKGFQRGARLMAEIYKE